MHSLLKRQLKKHFGSLESVPEDWNRFLDTVDAAYADFDANRGMVERSLELSSKELLDANSEMRALFQAIPDLFFRLDSDGTILDYKGEDPSRFWLSPEKLIGKRIQSVPVKEIGDKFSQAIQRVREDKSLIELDYELLREGRRSVYEARLFPVRESNIIAVVRDITARKEAEDALRKVREELEVRVAERTAALTKVNFQLKAEIEERKRTEAQLLQSQKMEAIGKLAGGVAHDFNNLLTVILANCEFLQDSLKSEASGWAEVEEIRATAMRAAALTQQLLIFSRKQVFQPIVLDLNVLVAKMAILLHRLLGEPIQLVTNLGANLGCVKADPGRIEQVIMNLAVNARDAMPKGGRLMIETANAGLKEPLAGAQVDRQGGAYVMLCVRDTGAGIDPQTLPRIFEPFFTTKKDKGTGLGLSTVYGIIQQSGGTISVESQPGAGTTFKICLPRVEGPAVEPAAKTRSPGTALSGSETVLLVEDESAVRKAFLKILQDQGYRVLEAGHAEEAVRISEEHGSRIDILVSDVVMPGMNGKELAQRLTASRPELKVLLLSGYAESFLTQPLEPGIHFLPKPFSPGDLAKTVRQVLDRR